MASGCWGKIARRDIYSTRPHGTAALGGEGLTWLVNVRVGTLGNLVYEGVLAPITLPLVFVVTSKEQFISHVFL